MSCLKTYILTDVLEFFMLIAFGVEMTLRVMAHGFNAYTNDSKFFLNENQFLWYIISIYACASKY